MVCLEWVALEGESGVADKIARQDSISGRCEKVMSPSDLFHNKNSQLSTKLFNLMMCIIVSMN